MTDLAIEAIYGMKNDVIRVRCELVLLSPDLHEACLEKIESQRWPDEPMIRSGRIFIRGVQADKCLTLGGMKYALVPAKREDA